jgi:hypothetical protein
MAGSFPATRAERQYLLCRGDFRRAEPVSSGISGSFAIEEAVMRRSHTEVQKLAIEFGRRISALVRAQVADEVDARTERVLKGISDLAGVDFGRSLKVGSREKSVIVVHCPVPGCRRPGVRPKRNFCLEHAASLSQAAKTKYRGAQQAQQAKKPRQRRA